MAFGTAKQIAGFADVFGGKNFNVVDYSGPTSYAGGASGGDLLDPKAFGAFNDIIIVLADGCISQDGTLYVQPQPVNNGVTAWRLRWFTLSTAAEVANGTNLSGKTVKLGIIGS